MVEEALAKLLGQETRVNGAGRTDAGVHATGQVISFGTANALSGGTIERGVNALLPRDVAIRGVAEVDEGFHARYSATSRAYAYTIWNARYPRPLLLRTAWWVREALDVERMREASARLVGRHDFAAFAMKTEDSRERTVRRADWSAEGGMLRFEIEADGFLRGMVRGIVGTLARVGWGKLDAPGFADVMAGGRREAAAASAPPQGLCLTRVSYDDATYHRRSEEDE